MTVGRGLICIVCNNDVLLFCQLLGKIQFLMFPFRVCFFNDYSPTTTNNKQQTT
uniref:Uncharacterized protein n=1 Tax=Daphnia magna TaxID=35525 RepID=A0A0P6GN54_9CRUS